MVENWLITGGCGYIGTSLISKLLAQQPTVNIIVLDNLTVGTREDLANVCSFVESSQQKFGGPDGCQLVVGDICNEQICKAVCRDADCIVHFAANTGVGPSVEDPRSDMEANVIGTFNMLEAARVNNVKHFIFASSGAPTGEVEPPIHEEMAPHPVSPYGASKLAGEGYCSAYYKTFGVQTISLRFGNVYGPRSRHKSSVIAKFVRQAMEGRQCEIYGDGSQTRDFIYIDDLIDAILRVAVFDGGGEVFQIASNRERTINEVVDLLKTELSRVGVEMRVNNAEKQLGDVMRNFSDINKARTLLGWEPKTSFLQGVRKTVDYFYDLQR